MADNVERRRGVGLSLTVLAALVIGFLAFLLGGSQLQEQRTQDELWKSFRGELRAATAPVVPTTPGRPVAVLAVPRLHLRQVVVEGTTAGQLTRGPGHRRDTALPGQAGISVILGRASTFGGPFRRLATMQPGDEIDATTGQGTAIYRVTSVRDSRASFLASSIPSAGLVLATGAPAYHPDHGVLVTAALRTSVQPSAGVLPAIAPGEALLASDNPSLPLALWGQLLVIAIAAAAAGFLRWHRWATWLSLAPVLVAVSWNIFENAARLLPNTL